MLPSKHRWVVCLLPVLLLVACTGKKGKLGTAKNPVKLFFVPSVDAKVIEDKSRVIKEILERTTPYKYDVAMPSNYVAVVEAFGTKRADVAALNTFGYLLANDKYGAEALLTLIRFGEPDYKAQIIARADGPIQTIEDIAGKRFAFVDPSSTSGYLLPLKVLHDKGIKPSETVFAQKHDNVISMIYQKQVDAGATFYTPAENGVLQDARRLVKNQYPDVEKKIKIVELTEAIPNDPIVFRKDLPVEMKKTIVEAFINMMNTPDGRDAFLSTYGATSFKRSSDDDYIKVRQMLSALGKNAADLMNQ